MCQSRINETWIRWLDRRPVNQEILDQLTIDLTVDEKSKQRLMDDLDIHRQLQALASIPEDDFSFVDRMLVRFETDVSVNAINTGETASSLAERSVVAASSERVVGPGIPVELDRPFPLVSVDRVNRKAPKKQKSSFRFSSVHGLALVIPLMAALLFAAFELGKQTARDPGPLPSQQNKPADRLTNVPRAIDQQRPTATIDENNQSSETNQRTDWVDTNPPDKDTILDDKHDVTVQGIVKIESVDDQVKGIDHESTSGRNDSTFATIQDRADAVWTLRPATYPRLEKQTLKLLSGQTVIEFDVGGVITVTGPANLVVDLLSNGSPPFLPPEQQFQTPEMEAMKEKIRKLMEEMGSPGFSFPENGFQGRFSFSFEGNDAEFQMKNANAEDRESLIGSMSDLVDELRKQGPAEK